MGEKIKIFLRGFGRAFSIAPRAEFCVEIKTPEQIIADSWENVGHEISHAMVRFSEDQYVKETDAHSAENRSTGNH
ncbi:MAG: hypothetical protein HQL65_17080 [Magnetococcales bacterium]|nr:hypothetical protein [Magnetococcales bacterium]